jgi:hypothetical protein
MFGGTGAKIAFSLKITIPGNVVFPGIIGWLRGQDLKPDV